MEHISSKILCMGNMSNNIYSIQNTIFADDNAVLMLVSLLEAGETNFFMALYNEKAIFNATINRLDNGRYQLNFSIPESLSESIDIDDFFKKPVILMIPSPNANVPNLNIIVSQNDVESVKLSINEGSRKVAVTLKAFRADFDDQIWNQSKQTAIFRFNPSKFDPSHKGIIYDITTNKDQTYKFKNAVKIELKSKLYLFYYEEISKDLGFFIIKSPDLVCHDDLEEAVDAIRSAYALLTGYYIAESVFYFSMKPKDKKSLTFRYQSLNRSINSPKPILDYHRYQNIDDEKLLMTSDVFENLVKILYKNVELRRACVLITQAGTLDNISKGSLASVSLETITSAFNNATSEKHRVTKLIEDKAVITQLKYELQKATKKVKDKLDKEIWNKLWNKISKFNELPNASKLSSPFVNLGINLSEEEEYCITCRNLYLHGNVPKPKGNKYKYLTQDELQLLIADRLCMLSAMLLLKKAGYNGYVVDWGATEIVYKREIAAGHGNKHLTFQLRDMAEQDNDKE